MSAFSTPERTPQQREERVLLIPWCAAFLTEMHGPYCQAYCQEIRMASLL